MQRNSKRQFLLSILVVATAALGGKQLAKPPKPPKPAAGFCTIFWFLPGCDPGLGGSVAPVEPPCPRVPPPCPWPPGQPINPWQGEL